MTKVKEKIGRDNLVRKLTRAEEFAIAILGTFIFIKFIVLGILHGLT